MGELVGLLWSEEAGKSGRLMDFASSFTSAGACVSLVFLNSASITTCLGERVSVSIYPARIPLFLSVPEFLGLLVKNQCGDQARSLSCIGSAIGPITILKYLVWSDLSWAMASFLSAFFFFPSQPAIKANHYMHEVNIPTVNSTKSIHTSLQSSSSSIKIHTS